MKVALAFVALLSLALAVPELPAGSPVSQCTAQDLECPEFTLGAVQQGYETRTYPPGKWVSTTYIGMNPDNSDMFNKLFQYISGANDKNTKIAMTAPVLTEVVPGSGPNCESNFTMSFYVPSAIWQDTPRPSAHDVYLQDLPQMTVYVKAFGGYAGTADFISVAAKLASDIGDSSKFLQGMWFTASYDSPFKFWDRRNEVWFIAK